MVFLDYLGEGGMNPVEGVPVRGGVFPQGDNARKELRGNLGDGQLLP